MNKQRASGRNGGYALIYDPADICRQQCIASQTSDHRAVFLLRGGFHLKPLSQYLSASPRSCCVSTESHSNPFVPYVALCSLCCGSHCFFVSIDFIALVVYNYTCKFFGRFATRLPHDHCALFHVRSVCPYHAVRGDQHSI